MSLDLKPASLQQLATNVHEWPDIQVARSAQTVRHEVVPVLGALRHAEVMALLLYRHRRFRAGFNAAVAAITNVAVSLQETGGILNDEEVDWLQKAYESDLKELGRTLAPFSRRRPKREGKRLKRLVRHDSARAGDGAPSGTPRRQPSVVAGWPGGPSR